MTHISQNFFFLIKQPKFLLLATKEQKNKKYILDNICDIFLVLKKECDALNVLSMWKYLGFYLAGYF